MREYKGKIVEEILKNLDPQKKEITERLRSIVKKAIPNAPETIKWGNILSSEWKES
jgi:uncharacterized protein YdhG (YjbR/CyaY superfamily)